MRRSSLLTLALGLAVVSMSAQGRGVLPGPLVQQVRTMLGHGDVAGAKRLVESGQGDPAMRELSLAVIEIFAGNDTGARTRLTPLANAAPLGEASLELGLLDMRTGRRDEALNRLDRIVAVRSFNSPDDYFRLARAARATREFLLANDAYRRIDEVPRADIQSEWGDLFVERHQNGDASVSFKKAIELDPNWIPALLGLAQVLADDDPKAAGAALDEAKRQAPDHPRVWLAIAERALDEDDLDAAKAALDRVAEVKPKTVDETALRAAIAYHERGTEAVAAFHTTVAALDGSSNAAYRSASDQAARDYRFDDAAMLARKSAEIDPDDPRAYFNLGLALLRTGDEAAARTALESSWALDKSAPVTKNLLDLLDRLDAFQVVEHGPFIFKFAKEETNVLKAYALPLADEAYRTFVARYGFTPKGPLLIEVFPNHDDFAVRTLGLPGLAGALGACFGRVVSMDSPSARPPGDFSWQATLWHELAHVFSLQLSEYRVPRWLTEGISVYEEHRRQPAWGRELTLQYARQVAKGQNFGVKKLPQAFKQPQTLSLAYFEASLVVEHLVALNGDAGLRALLLAYANGAKDEEAFAEAFAQSVDAVEASFATFINGRYGALSRAMGDPPREVAGDDLPGLRARAEAAPGNFQSQMTFGQALVREAASADAIVPLERAAALAPEAMGPGSARALLAQIFEQRGDRARARRELRALLVHDHTNVDAARQLAKLAAQDKATDDEDYALRLVADLDPFDADTHAVLGRRLLARGDATAALVEFQASLALGPANLAEANADIAEALLKLGRRAEARQAALAALREAPTFARAQDLLLSASGQ